MSRRDQIEPCPMAPYSPQEPQPQCDCGHPGERHLTLATSNRCTDCDCEGYEADVEALDPEDVEWVRWSHIASPMWIFGDPK